MFGRQLQNTYCEQSLHSKPLISGITAKAGEDEGSPELHRQEVKENNNSSKKNPSISSRSFVAVSKEKSNKIAPTMTRVTSTNLKPYLNQKEKNHSIESVSSARTNSNLSIAPVSAQPILTINTTEAERGSSDGYSRAPPPEAFEFFDKKQFTGLAEQKLVLTMQLKSMIERSSSDSVNANSDSYESLKKSQVEQIQHFCKALSTNQATTFRTLEIYDRFVARFNTEKTRNTGMTEKVAVQDKLLTDGPLRICSCILLASKLHSDNNTRIITTRRLNALLIKCGYNFSAKTIAWSEIRVMTILNFRLHWVTPFDLVEQMISLVDLSNLNVRKVYHHSMILLEFCYSSHHKIYLNFWKFRYQQSNHRMEKHNRKLFKFTIEFNSPLRSAAIVSSAIFLNKPHASEHIFQELASVTAIPQNDIKDLSFLILDIFCH